MRKYVFEKYGVGWEFSEGGVISTSQGYQAPVGLRCLTDKCPLIEVDVTHGEYIDVNMYIPIISGEQVFRCPDCNKTYRFPFDYLEHLYKDVYASYLGAKRRGELREVSSKSSDDKRVSVNKLVEQQELLNVKKLHDLPNHKETKDWLASTGALLKKIDSENGNEFDEMRKNIYPDISRKDRIRAAHRIDAFVRQKVQEYKNHDFSDASKPKKEKVVSPSQNFTTQFSGPVGQVNQANKQEGLVTQGGVDSRQQTEEGKWYEKWLGLIVTGVVIGVIVIIIGALVTNFFGLTKP